MNKIVKTKWLHQTETQVDTEIFTTKEYENTQVFARVAHDVFLVTLPLNKERNYEQQSIFI